VPVLVKDIMVSRNLLTANEADRLASAAQKMLWGRLRHLPVVRGDEVVGVLSERDVLARRDRAEPVAWEDELVGAVMSRPALVAVPDQEVAQAAARMAAHRIGCLPVVHKGRLVGMLTATDLMGAAVSELFRSSPALRHPVSQAMRDEVFSVRRDQSVMEAVELMAACRIRHIPVVDDEGRVVGVLSDRDVRVALGEPVEAVQSWPGAATRMAVSNAMTPDPIVVRSDAPLAVAVAQLLNRGIGALPVIDGEGHLCGILSYVDVIRALSVEPLLVAKA
jgi:CBS-domain-containing membrane protein